MAPLPQPPNQIANLIDAHHERNRERPRPHMGVSLLGHECERYLWLSFRWAVREVFSGRMLRLFRRGHNEEAMIISDLEAIGVVFKKSSDDAQLDGAQARVTFGSHVSGSLDGIIEHDIPKAPKGRHVAEFKTHSQKSFDELKKLGVEKSKPMHFIQMQCYMFGTGIDRALYVAINKNTDEYYTERIRLDKAVAERAIARGQRLALDMRAPPPISFDPSWFKCKMCPMNGKACHTKASGTKPTIERNCRTCENSRPMPDSTWFCTHWQDTIPLDAQYEGCGQYQAHHDLTNEGAL